MTRKHEVLRWAAFALILAVTCLSVTVTHSRFLPKSDPGHFVSKTTKMNLGHSPDLFIAPGSHPMPEVLLVQPQFCDFATILPENFELPQLHLTLSLQHRSPPFCS